MTRKEMQEHKRLQRRILAGRKVTRAEALRAHELLRKARNEEAKQ